MVEQPPPSYIGEVYDAPPGNVVAARSWLFILQQWNANTTILMPPHLNYYCDGRCEGNIRATGLITNCSSITRSVDLSKPLNNETTVFNINFTRGEDYNRIPTLTLIATYSVAVDNTCVATIVNETCDVKVASVQYPIVVENQTITFDSDKYSNMGELEAYAGDSLDASLGNSTGPLGGLSATAEFYWWANANVVKILDPKANTSLYDVVMMANTVTNQYFVHHKEGIGAKNYSCVITFNRPMGDIIQSFLRIMFRAGLYLAAANDMRNIPMVQTTPVLVYQSDYWWFGVAITVMAIATFSCLIPHWGWWAFGREVSLNPIETAKAFNVPEFRMVGLGYSAKDIVKDMGHLQVGYVEVEQQDAAGNPVPTMELRPLET